MEESKNDRSKEVAENIMMQLGRKALFMMGASKFVHCQRKYSEKAIMPSLSFQIKGSKVKYIVIYLNALDYYNVRFLNLTGKLITEVENIFVEDLHRTIETNTGLYLSIG